MPRHVTRHPFTLHDRARRAVLSALERGCTSRAAIIEAARDDVPLDTSALVICALSWLRARRKLHYVRGPGWQPGPAPMRPPP